MKAIFRNPGKSKTSEPHKCVLNLPQKLDLKSADKYDRQTNLFITRGKL